MKSPETIKVELKWTGLPQAQRYVLRFPPQEPTLPYRLAHAVLGNCPMGETEREARQGLSELNERRVELELPLFEEIEK